MTEQEWEELLTLLYGAWEDSGILQEEEGRLARMRREPEEWTEDAIGRVEARVGWMHDFYRRVVLPRTQAQNGELRDDDEQAVRVTVIFHLGEPHTDKFRDAAL